ncbi:antibiotic biosynthesis monooxygenase family protein [Paraburkholderia bannensis]|uniref:antibiotic biosynthesis monooxygenase family protein n=1 Tax=Paraburkholderia bannensis TaxID=765414 RepID=UPI002ABD7B70|nr:antibiotic biosynthesis monooxygenase [Paraburkholderia bannensis]
MLIAIARFHLRPEKAQAFEAVWQVASAVLVNKDGYRGHRLGPQCEDAGCYVLEIEWDSLDSQSAFMAHADFQPFLHSLWPFFAADPELIHFEPLGIC